MTNQHHHPSQHNHHGHGAKHPNASAKRGLHKDWRVWTAVVLMLAAMAVYLMSMDESIQPGGNIQEPVPEAPAE